MNTIYLEAALSALTLGGAGLILYGPMQSALTSMVRQRHFERRDELFEMAVSGQIAFDDEAYIETRKSINSSLRYAHGATLPRIVWHRLTHGKNSYQFENKAEAAISRLGDADLKKKLTDLLGQTSFETVLFMFARSPLTVFSMFWAIPIVLIVSLVAGGIIWLRPMLRPIEDRVQEECASLA